ncbi:MAG: hypothetical protein DMF76_27335 [Acidobacteria bacterium]|nr:MAG: hypothetical protein DMF76_27335 [Acidobacteriota bacterium]
MKTLQRLGAAIALMFVFAFAAFADCLPPEPGIMSTPPCSSATPDDPVAAAEPSESFTSSTPNVIEISVTTLDVILSALSLF